MIPWFLIQSSSLLLQISFAASSKVSSPSEFQTIFSRYLIYVFMEWGILRETVYSRRFLEGWISAQFFPVLMCVSVDLCWKNTNPLNSPQTAQHLKEFLGNDHVKVKFIPPVPDAKLTYFSQFVSLLQVYIIIIPVTAIISRLFWIENKELAKIWTPSKDQLKSSKGFSHLVNVLLYDL